MEKIIKYAMGIIIIIMCLGFFNVMPANAAGEMGKQEETDSAVQVMKAVGAVKVRETPDLQADVIGSYEDGEIALVVGVENNWYRVSYQEGEGYVPKYALSTEELERNLHEDFQIMKEEGKLVVEEVERYRAESRRSKVWGAVIIVLIAGIFATGIIATVRNSKKQQ